MVIFVPFLKYKWFPDFSGFSKYRMSFKNINDRIDLTKFCGTHIKKHNLGYMWYPTFLFCAFIKAYSTLILNGFQKCPRKISGYKL